MYHFFVEPEQIFPDHVEIRGGDVNHIKNVLRLRPGDEISASDGLGVEYLCSIQELLKDVVQADILKRRKEEKELASRLVLYQGIPKGDRMDLVVQKAVELGAKRIVPVAFGRCIVKLDHKKAQARQKRWQAIAESAAKQAGRSVVPEVGKVLSAPEAFEDAKGLDVRLIPYECAKDMEGTRQTLSQIKKGQSVGVFIGPEGGFELSEVEEAVRQGACPITLGRRILRTETAGLCILSVLMFWLED